MSPFFFVAQKWNEAMAKKTVLIIVENLPVPMDRRVWQQATALVRAGFEAHVICPKSEKYTQSKEELQGVVIHRHSLPVEGDGILRYVLEYAWALAAEGVLTARLLLTTRVDAIQACNPPDNIFLIGTLFKLITGGKFIFDHHDPFAELFSQKFSGRPRLRAVVDWFELQSLRCADRVITTSEELRQLAIVRHGIEPSRVAVVRSGFDLTRIPMAEAEPALKRGRKFLILYVGVMGAQDGLDLLLEAVAYLVYELKYDAQFVLAGGGPELRTLRRLSSKMNLDQYVEFTGYLEGSALIKLFKTADLGVCPDPKNSFNDKLSMNKVLEYMAFGLPIVQFDLLEGSRLAGDAAAYACDNDPRQLALAMAKLLSDPKECRRKGELGIARVRDLFSWQKQEDIYLSVYRQLLEPTLPKRTVCPDARSSEALFGFQPCTSTISEVLKLLYQPLTPGEGVKLIVTPNIDHVARLRYDEAFKRAYSKASVVVCDGFPVFLIAKLRGYAVKRITGCDIICQLMRNRDVVARDKFFFIVDSERTAMAVSAWATSMGPSASVQVIFPPNPFLRDENWRVRAIQKVRAFEPKFLIVAVGAPQSEIFVDESRDDLPQCWALCVGQAVKVEVGLVRRAPRAIRTIGMEWAWRSFQEPRRLLPKYARASYPFLRSALTELYQSVGAGARITSDGGT